MGGHFSAGALVGVTAASGGGGGCRIIFSVPVRCATIRAGWGNHAMTRRKPSADRGTQALPRVALAAVLLTGDAAVARAFKVIGAGWDSCGTWTADRRQPPGRQSGHPLEK